MRCKVNVKWVVRVNSPFISLKLVNFDLRDFRHVITTGHLWRSRLSSMNEMSSIRVLRRESRHMRRWWDTYDTFRCMENIFRTIFHPIQVLFQAALMKISTASLPWRGRIAMIFTWIFRISDYKATEMLPFLYVLWKWFRFDINRNNVLN